MNLRLVFETHATSEDNERGVATGWNGGRLSEAGRRQATELGRRRRDDGVDAVFSSDLRRAVETAEIAFAGSGIPVFLDWRLRECDYGELNSMPRARLEAERHRRLHEPWPGGESWREAVARVDAALEELAAAATAGGSSCSATSRPAGRSSSVCTAARSRSSRRRRSAGSPAGSTCSSRPRPERAAARAPGAERLAEDALERVDDATVEGGADFAAQERERLLGRPGGPVHALGDERVVDVAGGEDARVESDRERADVRAEKHVLGGDELDGREVAGERPRRRRAGQVDRDGDPDREDAVELDLLTDPPAQLLVAHGQRREERRSEPHEADDHGQVEHAPRQQERAERAQRHDAVGEEADREQRERMSTSRRGHGREQIGMECQWRPPAGRAVTHNGRE